LSSGGEKRVNGLHRDGPVAYRETADGTMDFDYSAARVAVREDIRNAHRDLWEHLRAPGTWI